MPIKEKLSKEVITPDLTIESSHSVEFDLESYAALLREEGLSDDEISNLKISITDNLPGYASGLYWNDTISVNPSSWAQRFAPERESLSSILLHETKHFIDDIHGQVDTKTDPVTYYGLAALALSAAGLVLGKEAKAGNVKEGVQKSLGLLALAAPTVNAVYRNTGSERRARDWAKTKAVNPRYSQLLTRK